MSGLRQRAERVAAITWKMFGAAFAIFVASLVGGAARAKFLQPNVAKCRAVRLEAAMRRPL
jgi:hypothetical protein